MIGEKIKTLAEKANKSREQMAVLLDISLPTLHRIYKSDNVDSNVLKKVAKTFDVSISYFFDDSKNIDTIVKNNETKQSLAGEITEELRSKMEMMSRYISSLETEITRYRYREDEIYKKLESGKGFEIGDSRLKDNVIKVDFARKDEQVALMA